MPTKSSFIALLIIGNFFLVTVSAQDKKTLSDMIQEEFKKWLVATKWKHHKGGRVHEVTEDSNFLCSSFYGGSQKISILANP